VTRPDLSDLLAGMDSSRRALGFLDLAGLASLARCGIHILDPFSALVSPGTEIEAGAVLQPNVILEVTAGGRLHIGARTRLSAGTHLFAAGGSVLVGSDAEIGDQGGFTARATPYRRLAASGRVPRSSAASTFAIAALAPEGTTPRPTRTAGARC
jgi:hypothetical protein